jgi:two-component system LytT family response regulator
MLNEESQLSAVIIDDEPAAIRSPASSLEPHSMIQVIGSARTQLKAKELIETLRPDIVFLDINLGTTDAFSLLDSLLYRDFQLIFVTAYDKYALKAYEYSAVNYLLKPVDEVGIENVLSSVKVKKGLNYADALSLLSKIMNHDRDSALDKIALPTLSGIVLKQYKDIRYLKAVGSNTVIYLEDKAQIIGAKPLKVMEERLINHNFYRINHSMIINCDRIDQYKQQEGKVIMDWGANFSVSFRKRSGFVKYLTDRTD